MRTSTIGLITAAAAVALGCSSGADAEGPGAQSAAGDSVSGDKTTVVFEVTGPKKADITYSTGTDQSQENGARQVPGRTAEPDRVTGCLAWGPPGGCLAAGLTHR
jgi:hypothetical protein